MHVTWFDQYPPSFPPIPLHLSTNFLFQLHVSFSFYNPHQSKSCLHMHRCKIICWTVSCISEETVSLSASRHKLSIATKLRVGWVPPFLSPSLSTILMLRFWPDLILCRPCIHVYMHVFLDSTLNILA